MSIVQGLQFFAESEGWSEHVKIHPSGRTARLNVSIEQEDGSSLVLNMAGDDESETLQLAVTLPIRVPLDQSLQAARLLNRINDRLTFGHYSFFDSEPMQPIILKGGIDGTGSAVTGEQIVSFVGGLWGVLAHFDKPIRDVCVDARDVSDAWYEFVAVNFDKEEHPEYYEEDEEGEV